MKRSTLIQLLKQVICIGMVLIVLAPIVLTLFAAFKTKADMVNTSPLLLPPVARITLENFQKVLTDNLRALEADGLIDREVFAEVPPRVVYSISALGDTLRPIIDAMQAWGTEYTKNFM